MKHSKKVLLFGSIIFFLLGLIWYGYIHLSFSVLILFQNNYELRPTGGFLGSYGRITVHQGKLQDLQIQDIYVPDGQLDGHVDPPWPIQSAFGQGWFKLRDSNFDPDFPSSAQTILWFFEKGKEPPVDGVIAINLEVFKAILDVLGPIQLPDETVPLTTATFYQLMQSEAEIGFFPGSQQKQVYLSKVGKATRMALEHASFGQKLRLTKKLFTLLREKHIFLYAKDSTIQKLVSFVHIDGGIKRGKGNYFSFFETNLGTNKANCCIKRSVKLEIDRRQYRRVSHSATITFENDNPSTLKNPPYTWGGAYVNYLRVYLPIEANIESLTVAGEKKMLSDRIEITKGEEPLWVGREGWEESIATHSAVKQGEIVKFPDKSLQSVGFFMIVDALQQKEVKITYDLPQSLWDTKTLFIQKQSGIIEIPYQITVDGETKRYTIKKDTKISTKNPVL